MNRFYARGKGYTKIGRFVCGRRYPWKLRFWRTKPGHRQFVLWSLWIGPILIQREPSHARTWLEGEDADT